MAERQWRETDTPNEPTLKKDQGRGTRKVKSVRGVVRRKWLRQGKHLQSADGAAWFAARPE
jgi:hypothetical protein